MYRNITSTCISMNMLHAFNDSLREYLGVYQGRYADVINQIPDVLTFYESLLEDPSIPEIPRRLVNGSIAYIIAPFLSNEASSTGPAGFLDDIYLCAWTLEELEKQLGSEVLEFYWRGEGDLNTLINNLKKRSMEFVGDLENELKDHFNNWINQCSKESELGDGSDVVNTLLELI